MCQYKAFVDGADIYNGGTINDLSSAKGMAAEFLTYQDGEFQPSGFMIDGWYRDEADARWSKDTPSANKYLGDTYDFSTYQSLIAAFTPFTKIDITKIWNDNNNAEGLHPSSVTLKLMDRNGLPVRLMTLDGTPGELAEITMSEESAPEDDPNMWKGTIGPLAVGDYKGFKLNVSVTALYHVEPAETEIELDPQSDEKIEVTFVYSLPLEHSLSYDPNGGTGSIEKQTDREGNSITVKSDTSDQGFSREHYLFVNWNTV